MGLHGMAMMLGSASYHPFSAIMNAGRKVVFSRTLRTAEWVGPRGSARVS